jgi:phosphoglycerate kinase
MTTLSISDIDVKDKRVLCRVDFNVPLDGDVVTDNKRIEAALPTIKHIIENGGKCILMSHLGRPKGEKNLKYSLKPASVELSKLLGLTVAFAENCIGEEAENAANNLKGGDVLLLENLRFHPEEEKNDPEFSKKLAGLGDVFVNDAFGTAHRAHASTDGTPRLFKIAACGFLIDCELKFLGDTVSNPQSPFVAIMGGAKVKDKIKVLNNLLPIVDKLIIGGGMTYTFFKAQGLEIGDSLLDSGSIDFAKEMLDKYSDKILLPTDSLITNGLNFDDKTLGDTQFQAKGDFPAGWEGVDIGPETIKSFSEVIMNAKTVLWNGPMGVFEIEESAKGTMSLAHKLAEATENGTISIIGGGDSAAAVKKAGLASKMTHVSTGGGASLEFLEGKALPGIAALSTK